MTIANTSQESSGGLPQAMRTAQESIHLPEVQEMLRRLSEYKLGIFMPHMHDEHTGGFQPLPDDVIQVESGVEVSFHPMEEIAHQPDRYLPVGWLWRAGASTPAAACEMVWEEGRGDTGRSGKHKMKDACTASSAQPASLRRQG
jgi:glyoxylase-like metal-dependent hydrolase (beta-lactamase superfamily II)